MSYFYKILLLLIVWFYMLMAKIVALFYKPIAKHRTVLYLAAFFPGNAGYHWRVQKWADILIAEGYEVEIASVFTKEELDKYVENPFRFLIVNLHRRFWQVVSARKYQTVIVRRELLLFNSYGNHFLERLLRKLCKNIVLDIDDDLAAAKNEPKEVFSLFGKLLTEDGNSFRNSFSYYDGFFVASNYLKVYVQEYGGVEENRIKVIPTCVDYDKYPMKDYSLITEVLTLGWIGGAHNYHLIKSIIPVLNQLSKEYRLQLIVIGDGRFAADTTFPLTNKIWSLETEVEELNKVDIGLMPLDATDESKGKGGFKLIQYMGLGIVSVASAVTINKDIITDKVNGFLYETDEEFLSVLEDLLQGFIPLSEVGRNARETSCKGYVYSANTDHYLSLISNRRND